jgi:hypothetical protein
LISIIIGTYFSVIENERLRDVLNIPPYSIRAKYNGKNTSKIKCD